MPLSRPVALVVSVFLLCFLLVWLRCLRIRRIFVSFGGRKGERSFRWNLSELSLKFGANRIVLRQFTGSVSLSKTSCLLGSSNIDAELVDLFARS